MTNHSTLGARVRATLGPARRLTFTVLALTAVACGTEDAPDPLAPSGPQGRVRFVNLITDVTRGRVNAILEGVAFGVDLTYTLSTPATLGAPSTAPYAPVLTGDRTIVLKRTADTSVTVATLDFTIEADQDRTVYAIGGANNSAVTAFVTTDTNTVTAGQTRVRLVHLSPTAGALDIFITAVGADLAAATASRANIANLGVSTYLPLAPGTYQVRAVPAGTAPAARAGAVVINLASVAFTAGTTRTIVAADNNVGGTPLRFFVLADR